MQTTTIAISDLSSDPANARSHSKANLDAIAGSLRRFGQQKPIVVDSSGVVRAGNGTLAAAKLLGWEEIEVVHTKLKGSEATAFAIADNRTAELADWDDDVLAASLHGLDEELQEATGFVGKELDEILASLKPKAVIEDKAPDVPEEAKTKRGQLWRLGEHRLLCGDATSSDDLSRLMGSAKADLLVTDPPYNVDYVGKTKEALTIENDSMSDAEFRHFLVNSFSAALDHLKPGASFYIWHADSEGYNFRGAVHDCGEQVRQCLIWHKSAMVMGRQDYQWKHEPCLYGWKQGAAHNWYSDRKQTTILEYPRPDKSIEHPTMKPVALISYQIGNSAAPEGLVLDTFLGSGTTLIAAEQLGRTCYGLEVDPRYCDVIVERWQNLTGEEAHLDGT